MSTSKKFRFVSPGVYIDEIDRSQIPRLPAPVGPVIIGRTTRGPGMVPVTVGSWEEYVSVFGLPERGAGGADIWRDGNSTSPHYAAYAAQAYLKNSSPVTIVRLLGTDSPEAETGDKSLAGWVTENAASNTTNATNGGAFGLFIIPSSSNGDYSSNVTGALAAVWYLDKGAIRLVGDDMEGADVGTDGASNFVASVGSNYEFRAIIENDTGTENLVETTFNFNPNSSKYIRKVFNTNPTLTNNDVTPSESLRTYWLGESFESHLRNVVNENSGNIAGDVFGAIVALETTDINLGDFQGVAAQPAKTGWVFSQDLSGITGSFDPTTMTKLFRFVINKGDGSGEYEQGNVKVSIQDIKQSTSVYDRYGTFTVAIRDVEDRDNAPRFLEVFPNCNLNPASVNFIGNKIGDQYISWDETEKRHRKYGNFTNKSNYVRVEVNPVIEQGGVEPEALPFGFYGPPRFKSIPLTSGSAVGADYLLQGGHTDAIPDSPAAIANVSDVGVAGITDFTASLVFPAIPLRVSASDAGTLDPTDAYFGIIAQKVGSSKFNDDYRDLVRAKPSAVDSYEASVTPAKLENSFVFTLDDIRAVLISGSDPAVPGAVSSVKSFYEAGSRAAGTSITAIGDYSASLDSGSNPSDALDGYKRLLDRDNNRFTMPFFGGSDGLDITERDPFRNTFMADATDENNYAFYSLKRAIDSVRDPEVLEMNLATIPGITNQGITNHLIDTVENRSDALAIIDLEGGYVPSHESAQDESVRLGSVASTVTALRDRALNTSYACAYYPWVRINDPTTGFPIWMPPSVAALGTMASSQEKSEVWFAPAGFNRGGLTEGAAGLSVIDVRENLSSKQRDKLYEVNINPIASFPAEGIVIFGQKTLQVTQSALDRINVRRLMIFLRKEISRISARLLFDQNVQSTWNRFLGEVEPFLGSVQSRFGLTEYKVILDETTTTPDLIDRNILYAKIFLKPARAIEFIALDFIITRTGASFEDL